MLKLGLDIHRDKFVVVAQYSPRYAAPAAGFCSRGICALGRRVGCGKALRFMSSMNPAGLATGSTARCSRLELHCYVIAPQQLDERNTRVKTDGRDGRALCLRLDRYLAGNKDSLAVIRVPSEREERARHWGRQREQLVRHRQKMEAQGRSLLISHGLPAPARWWRPQSWNRLGKLLPAWILPHLELYRPALLALDQQVGALTIELEKAAPAALPKGMGAMSSVVISREICDWQRFKNRRQVSSYTGLCPGEYSSGTKRVTGSVTKHGNGRLRAALVELAWRMVRFQPRYHAVQNRFRRPGKRRPSYWGAAQEGHCRCSSSAGCGPLEDSYRALHTLNPRI